jgi:AhpD family alkylhydroperoxidase
MTSELANIDPALGDLREFAKITGRTTTHIQDMRREAIFTDGAVPARLKALAAVLWSVSARCEPCLTFYVLKARELGATDAEIGEFLAIASVMGGCVGEMWALKAFHAMKPAADAGSSCCS